MAIPLTLFDTCYDFDSGKLLDKDCIYPVGIDPIWYLSKNELSY